MEPEGLHRLQRLEEAQAACATQTFLEASELGDAASLRERLRHLDADQRRDLVRSVDQQGASGLLLAVKRGDAEVAAVLLEAGANPNDMDSSGTTASHYASSRGDPSLLKLLLDAKSDPQRRDDHGDEPLAWAGSAEAAGMLLEARADVAARGVGGRTALMYACERGHLATARALALASSLDDGEQAWRLATENGHQEVAEMLVGLGVEVPQSQGRVMQQEEALFEAARLGDAGAIQRCALDALDVNVQEPGGDTPLLLACGVGCASAAVNVLLQAAADPNKADPFMGETPLHRAVLGGASLKVLMLLLEARADPQREDITGRTAVDVAESWSYVDAREVLMAAIEGQM